MRVTDKTTGHQAENAEWSVVFLLR